MNRVNYRIQSEYVRGTESSLQMGHCMSGHW